MTTPSDALRYQRALERWRVLAEDRLEHMTQLYETGRWRRYFSEERFLGIIRETKAAVELWQRLAPEQRLAVEQTVAPEQAAPAVQLFALPAERVEPVEEPAEPAFVRTQPPPSPFEMEAQRSVA
jgi:uncharacterized repeat protein (TIGR03809 family)